jgi:hypothetical protein
MENEGIMSLPGMEAMQGNGRAPQAVSSYDAYDAATTAMGMLDPQAVTDLRAEIDRNSQGMELTPNEIDAAIGLFEYLLQSPREYKKRRQEVIAEGVDPEDLPEEFDMEFLSAVLAVLNELKSRQIQGAEQAATMGPAMAEPVAPMAMAQGGLADMAQYLASKGRHGDTMLAHITPEEAQMLKRMGGSGTINPDTGLPEYFIKKLVKGVVGAVTGVVKSVVNIAKKVVQSPVGRVLATVALATVLGPGAMGLGLMSAPAAAAVAGAGTTLLAGGNIKDALVSGALGYIGGGGDFGGLGSPLKGLSSYLPGAAGSALNTGLTTAALGTGAGLVMGMKPGEALRSGAMAGLTAGALQGLQGPQQPVTSASQEAAIGTGPLPGAEGAIPASPTASAVTGTGAPGATGPAGGVERIGTAAGMLPAAGEPGGLPFTPPPSQFAPPTTPQGDLSWMDTVSPSQQAAIGTGALPGASAPGLIQRAKDLYGEYLSPDRPGLPPDAGLLRRYGPLLGAGLGVAAAGGAFKKPADEPEPLYKISEQEKESRERAEARQRELDLYGYGLTRGSMGPAPRGPVLVETPAYARMAQTAAPVSMPTGITNMPQGVAQPYNVAGLYGIPLLYGQEPVQRARGGEMKMTEFPRKTGPINGPGTGTSDSIPAMLSDGEFVFTAKAVRNAGNGSRRKGAARMYKLMKALEGGAVKA